MKQPKDYTPRRYDAMCDVLNELERAREKHPDYHSAHEGYAVILEELDELWDEIKTDAPAARMREEAVQVAATAIRFIMDICDSEKVKS